METFLKSHDFMRLGQAIEHDNYRIASMTIARMLGQAKELEDEFFIRQFTSLKMCVASQNKRQAKNVLSLIVNKRAQLLNQLQKEQ